MQKFHKCYVVCTFPESGYSTHITPHSIYGVYFSKAVLEHAHPEWKITWGVQRTSELIIGVTEPDSSGHSYFILVRALFTDDEISPNPELGSVSDAWDEFKENVT